MSRKKTSSPLPADILARRSQGMEQAKCEYKREIDAQNALYQLVSAADLAAVLGQDYEFEGKADQEYLIKWVEAIAAYKALLPAWPTEVPPDGVSENDRDARHVALNIFQIVDTAPAKAVQALLKLATKHRQFAASVGRWLRRDLYKNDASCRLSSPVVPATDNEVEPAIGPAVAKLDRLVRELENSASHPPSSRPDGPELPSTFWWKEKPYELPPISCRLLSCLWGKNNISDDKVIDEVWGHDAGDKEGALKAALNKLKNCLASAGVPWTYSCKKGHIIKQ